MPKEIRKDSNSFNYMLPGILKLERKQKATEQKLLDILKSCSRETRLNYSDMLKHNSR